MIKRMPSKTMAKKIPSISSMWRRILGNWQNIGIILNSNNYMRNTIKNHEKRIAKLEKEIKKKK